MRKDTIPDFLGASQTNRLLTLSFPQGDAPPCEMVVNTLEAVEALSCDFRFTLELLSDNASLELKDMLGKLLCVALVRGDGSLRYFTGYVFQFRLKKADGGIVYYEAVLGPWLRYLSLRRDNYLYHYQTLRQQTDSVLRDYGVLANWAIQCVTEKTPHRLCNQFNEDDHNFLHRSWERQGWLYWHEHDAKGHQLILSDDSRQTKAIDGEAEIRFQRAGGAIEEDAISVWSPTRKIAVGKVTLRSFNFKTGRATTAEAPTLNRQGRVANIESYDYAGHRGFTDQFDGRGKTDLRMERLEADAKHVDASSNNRYVQPGRWFRLAGHFDIDPAEGNEAREFLITSVQHSASNNYQAQGQMPSDYGNTFSCLRKIIRWRPGQGYNSKDTRIEGVQTALVVGPPKEEIYTDKYGRVKVQFHWDREGKFNEGSSAWIRVATSWSGSFFGAVAIPRIGSEVLVSFLDGDPNRPIITGMVPNINTMPPWTLPENKSQSGVLTRSTPGGAYHNANALRFEDKIGKEQLWLHAEKDQLTEVEHDEDKWVGNDRRKTVDHDETSHIKHDRTETVDNDETITVHNNRSERVDKNETIDIGGSRTKTIGKNRKDEIGKNWSSYVARMKTETVGMAYMQNVGLGRMENVGLAYNLNVGTLMATVVGINQITKVGKAISITAGEELTITVGLARIKMTADGKIFINGTQITAAATGPVEISGNDVDVN